MNKALRFLGLVTLIACFSAFSKPIKIAMDMASETATTLSVFASWQASSVPEPKGPINYVLAWKVNGATVRSDTVAALADTISFVRAPIGGADTVDFSIRSLYTANGNLSGPTNLTKVFANPDRQFPSVTVIITVDTLP